MNEDSYDDTVKRYYPKYFYCKVDNDKGSKYFFVLINRENVIKAEGT